MQIEFAAADLFFSKGRTRLQKRDKQVQKQSHNPVN